MKYLFAAVFVILLIASLIIQAKMPEAQKDKLAIRWVTDANPARVEQIRLYREWLKEHGYPDVEVSQDSANTDQSKKIIQGISGVLGEVVDIGDLPFFNDIGLLQDVTDEAKKMGYSWETTYPALKSDLTITKPDGSVRQFTYPCNVNANMYYVNLGVLEQFKQPVPPVRWDIATFEKLGKEFVDAANPPGRPRRYFYAETIDTSVLRRSMGGNEFNETLSRAMIDSPETIQTFELLKKWTNDLHIIPSQAEQAAFTTSSGYGGASLQLFNQGNYALLYGGRYLLIQLRQFYKTRSDTGQPPLLMSVVEPAHAGYPNVNIGTRAAGVFVGSRPAAKEAAIRFQAFLASKSYNEQLVDDADALPPDPKYTKTEEYLRPKKFPTEWNIHGPFADVATTIAVPNAYSPFIQRTEINNAERDARDQFLNNILSVPEACRRAQERLDRIQKQTLDEDPRLLPLYDKLVAQQRQIDDIKSTWKPGGEWKKIPMSLITNPFYQRYYKEKGLVIEDGK